LIDGSMVHPTPHGHDVLAGIVDDALSREVAERMLGMRHDDDGDGIYDLFEVKYSCESTNPDMDGDGFTDGQEVFETLSDPLDPSDPPLERQHREAPPPVGPGV